MTVTFSQIARQPIGRDATIGLRIASMNRLFGPQNERSCDSALSVLSATGLAASDDFLREVYCVLGVPIDAIDMPAVLDTIERAARTAAPFVISTPNINFLINSLSDAQFRESLLLSDLCAADGAPIVWIAQILGIPIRTRVAGSDFFDALKSHVPVEDPLKIFIFGSTNDVAAAAAAEINGQHSGITCVGWACPGFGGVEESSEDKFLESVNTSHADFLVVALGAKKGQLWLQRNHRALKIPVRSHLGAVVNYQAGRVKRAPLRVRRLGLEWLWRIKEEPYLWRRYWGDGRALLSLLVTRIIPLAIAARCQRHTLDAGHDLVTVLAQNNAMLVLRLPRVSTQRAVLGAAESFRAAVASGRPVTLDCSQTNVVDSRFFGLLLMLRKQLKLRGLELLFENVSPRLRKQFWLHGADHLLELSADGSRR